jgi:DNA-binding CsgD family transcriptional regulator
MTTTAALRRLHGVEVEHAEHGWVDWQLWPPTDGLMVLSWRRNTNWAEWQTQFYVAQVQRRRLLTPREVEVLSLIAEGMTAEQIARRLVLSVKTVYTHELNLKRRLKAVSLAHAVALGMRHGLIGLEPVHVLVRQRTVVAS